jgi:hypothetical protein
MSGFAALCARDIATNVHATAATTTSRITVVTS